MNYTIEIYLYDNKLIFTGTRDLYFEKWTGCILSAYFVFTK